MTMLAPVRFFCDMPEQRHGYVSKCGASFDSRCTKATEARQAAKENGWRHLAGYDFCAPVGGDTPLGKDHAGLMRSHRPTIRRILKPEDLDGDRHWREGTWQVHCSCTWAISQSVIHPSVMSNGLTSTRDGAAKVWMYTHVRIDVAGLTPQWTQDDVDRFRQETEELYRRLNERHRAPTQTPAGDEPRGAS